MSKEKDPKWIMFRRRHVPILFPITYYFLPFNKKTVGFDPGEVIQIIDGEWNQNIQDFQGFHRAGKYLLEQTLNDKNFIADKVKQSANIGEKFLKFCRKELTKENLSILNNDQLLEQLKKFYRYYQDFSIVNVPSWLYMADKMSEYTRDQIKEQIPENEMENIIAKLSSPNEMSYVNDYEVKFFNLLKLARESIKDDLVDENIEDVLKIILTNKKLKKVIIELEEKYFWLPFDYIGPEIWDKKYFISELKKHWKMSTDEINNKLTEIQDYVKNLESEQNKLKEKYRISKAGSDCLEIMKVITTLQDDKKAITTEAHWYLHQLFEEVATRTKTDFMVCHLMTIEEIEEMLKGKDFSNLLNERKEIAFTVVYNDEVKIYSGNEARKLAIQKGFKFPSEEADEEVKMIKGTIGSPGKVKGTVKVLLRANKANRLNEGEILVATMTSPDYVPAMKKAAAFITDEGGMTCHAAIIAREMKKPCIIGTKNATQVLHDGDEVEVDAERGLVKILKRKE